jgi:predicted component of type VI protein secretion system
MKVRLKILHGTLQDTHGHRAGLEVKVRGPRFVIGNAADCSMCCRSDSVLPHHCEVLLEPGRAVIRNLSDKASTFINGQPLEHERDLHPGDILRIGRLDFEVLIDEPLPAVVPPTQPEPEAQPEPESDAASAEISDLLVQADERDRAVRQEHPELRVLHVESASAKPAQPEPEGLAEADEAGKPKKKGKKKPGKLPTRPPKNEITGEDSTSAAQEALRKLFSR